VRYYCVLEPRRSDADGLVEWLSLALKGMGVDNLLLSESVLGVHGFPFLVDCGTDGASVNVVDQNGMKGKLEDSLPWMHWAWCYAHRLELGCNDAFSSQVFRDIDGMLLRLYYLHEKSPKSAVIYQTLLVILRRCLNFLKEVPSSQALFLALACEMMTLMWCRALRTV